MIDVRLQEVVEEVDDEVSTDDEEEEIDGASLSRCLR
jgi:hypothetical protein